MKSKPTRAELERALMLAVRHIVLRCCCPPFIEKDCRMGERHYKNPPCIEPMFTYFCKLAREKKT